jgi:hypothetical protein
MRPCACDHTFVTAMPCYNRTAKEIFMPHFWFANGAGKWGIQSLAGESCLGESTEHDVQFTPPVDQPGLAEIRLLPPEAAGVSPSWTLLGGRDATVRVNGEPLVLGVRVLRDRDEISFAGHRCFFSTEELVRIVSFPGLAQPAYCPRCKQKMEVGESAVACPHCHAWHHQTEKFPCWTYDTTCALCQLHSTALDAGYAWTPEIL